MFQLEFGARPLVRQSQDEHSWADGCDPADSATGSPATLFRLWASRAQQVEVLLVERAQGRESITRSIPLQQVGRQLFEGMVPRCPPGSLYYFRLDQNQHRPDPCSRFQPFGVHGPSQVIDVDRYRWQDSAWQGIDKQDLVIYEMHIGSFTPEGTYQAAIKKFPQLIELGVTAIELLPLVQTPGQWNWGYDGVHFFAPRNSYGSPDDLKCFIDTAHQMGLAVILDVVYNHVGPEGNYLNEFAHYRSTRHATPWGDSLNFDGPHSRRVRDFVIDNGLYWLDEYHFDGLRLDAIHYMFDQSSVSIVDEFKQRFRDYARTAKRKLWLIAESNIFDPLLLNDPTGNGDRYDGIWSDCLMHALYSHGKPDLRLTNRHYQGASDVLDALQYGYVFTIPQARRESPANRPPIEGGSLQYLNSLIMALQTHDSVGNHPHGKRIHQLISPRFQAAAAPLILLYPSIPMIFMGEEEASEAPFPFFADFEDPGLRRAVDQGRQDEYPHHHWEDSPLPSDPRAFLSSRLRATAELNGMWRWYQQLLKLRQQGQRQGWLSADTKQCSYDPQRQLFTLSFQTSRQQVFISSRLAPAEAPPCEMIFPNQAMLLLDSWTSLHPVPRREKDKAREKVPQGMILQAEHCLIWQIDRLLENR
jgi:maltooligosyltrehalose trehalohydrolase